MDRLDSVSNCSESNSPSPTTSNISDYSRRDYFDVSRASVDLKKYMNEHNRTLDSLDSGILSDTSETPSSYYETVINDLSEELTRSKRLLKEQENTFDRINKQNAELLSKFVSLQKLLQQKDSCIEALQTDKSNLKQKLSNALDKKKSVADQLAQIKDIAASLQIDVIVKKEEGVTFENSLKLLQERFRIFKAKYENLKEEHSKVLKENMKMQTEKQELFMSNNWQKCKLNNYTKLENEIQYLQEKLLHMIGDENHLKFENNKLLTEINKLKEENIKLKEMTNKKKTNSINESIYQKLDLLRERCDNLKIKIDKTAALTSDLEICQKDNKILLEKINELEAVIQVKTRKQIEQERRYEKNYSTLLRKIKEQKHKSKQIDENNTKTKMLHHTSDARLNIVDDPGLSKSSICITKDICHNCKLLANQLKDTGKQLLTFEQDNSALQYLIDCAKRQNDELKAEIMNFKQQRDESKSYILTLKNDYTNSETALSQMTEKYNDLTLELNKEKAKSLYLISKQNQMIENRKHDELILKTQYENTIQELQTVLQKRDEELNELQKCKEASERNWAIKAKKFENIIFALKKQIQNLKNEIATTQNHKFFLQRLCTDLKVAVKVHYNQNQALQNQLVEAKNVDSSQQLLPLSKPPSSTDNSQYISSLIDRSARLVNDVRMNHFHECLRGLKSELISIQRDIQEST